MSAAVAVIGAGRLADAVCDRLSAEFRLIRQLDLRDGAPKQAVFALLVSDGWNPEEHGRAEEAFRAASIPWLRGFAAFGEGAVGPLVRPGRAGCSLCADYRRLMAGSDRREALAIRRKLSEEGGTARDIWASWPAIAQMAQLLAEETGRFVRGEACRTENAMFLISFTTLIVSRHPILSDPACEFCGGLPDDSAAAAAIELKPNPKISPDSYRTRPLEDWKPVLIRDYVDYRTGLLNGKVLDLQSPFADASVNLPWFGGDEGTAGRTHRYSDSLFAAVLEGLERHCGMMPRGRRTVVRDSWNRLKDISLNPLSVGLHAEEQYGQPDFPFQAFDPDEPMAWVWGYSLLQNRPVLVPESIAYYSMGRQGFVYETSNGCALGGSLEEAAFYGILEVVERDSFLLTWYAQLPLPQWNPESVKDPEMRLMLDRLRSVAGYEILMFNSTMEHGIPSVWAIARNVRGEGANLICAAGAHPDPLRAAKGAVHELAGMLHLGEKLQENRASYERMLGNPYLVRQMEDHSLLYALPEAEDRFGFLLNRREPLRTFEEAYDPPKRNGDLTDDLREMLRLLRDAGLDVIAVDQSSPETRRNGLYCLKMLIPGMLPMTFGYHLTRLNGLERVLKVPYQLGYVREPLTSDRLNPHPHPFP